MTGKIEMPAARIGPEGCCYNGNPTHADFSIYSGTLPHEMLHVHDRSVNRKPAEKVEDFFDGERLLGEETKK